MQPWVENRMCLWEHPLSTTLTLCATWWKSGRSHWRMLFCITINRILIKCAHIHTSLMAWMRSLVSSVFNPASSTRRQESSDPDELRVAQNDFPDYWLERLLQHITKGSSACVRVWSRTKNMATPIFGWKGILLMLGSVCVCMWSSVRLERSDGGGVSKIIICI